MKIKKKIVYSLSSLFIILLLIQTCKDEPVAPSPNPEVLIAYPPDTSYITEDINIKVNVYNFSSVKNVRFNIDGTMVYADSVSPYEYLWNIYYWENKAHTILAEAVDGNDKIWKSKLITVYTNNDSQENILLIQPFDLQKFTDRNTIEFKWSHLQDAYTYKIETAIDSDFVNIFKSETTVDTNVIIEGFNLSKFYWHVKGIDKNNMEGSWSDYRTFTVSAPDPPILIEPANKKSMKTGSTVNLVWHKSKDAVLYEYQVSDSSGFVNIISSGQLPDTSVTIQNLPMGVYYWRVRCKNVVNFQSEWSDYFIFTIGVFSKVYGGGDLEYGSSIIETPDHGFLLLGKTASYGSGVYDIYLLKIDELGNILWSQTYGTPYDDRGEHMKLTSDGGIIIAGTTVVENNPYSNYNMYLVKTDINGNVEWENNFGGEENDFGYGVIETNDGGFIIVGDTRSYGAGDYDVYIIKTDNSGNESWSKTIGNLAIDGGRFINKVNDGNYIITGALDDNTCLVKIDESGNDIWSRIYSTFFSRGNYFCQLSNGNVNIVGSSGSSNMKLTCTDSEGNELWNKVLNQGFGSSVIEMDGNLISTGFDMSVTNVFIYSTDYSGNINWMKQIGGIQTTSSSELIKTYDGGFVMIGSTSGYGANESDIWLVKFDKNGNTFLEY